MIKLIFQAHLHILSKSSLRSLVEVFIRRNMVNREVSSANNLHLILGSVDESLIYVKNSEIPWIDS